MSIDMKNKIYCFILVEYLLSILQLLDIKKIYLSNFLNKLIPFSCIP